MKVRFNYTIDGEQVTAEEHRRRSRAIRKLAVPQVSRAYEKPLISQSAGCHPSQVASMNAFLASRGVTGARFLPNGNAEFDSRGGRNQFCRARGLIDQDGGYGDVTQ